MPAVNVEDQTMELIEKIQDSGRWDPSNREVVKKSVQLLAEEELDDYTVEVNHN